MPRSRDQRCQRVLNAFFGAYAFHYDLAKLNVRGYVYARYEITIPQQWTNTEPRYSREERALHWESIIKEQQLPDPVQIRNMELQFREKFQPYEKPNTSMRLYEVETSENDKVVFKIMVHYFKSYIPFPEDDHTLEQRIGQLERLNDDLQYRIQHFEQESEQYVNIIRRRNQRLARDVDTANNAVMHCKSIFNEHYTKFMTSYRTILKKCYAEMGKTYECPVCYENIPNESMFVTPCNHILCEPCASKCNDTCPMCRQEMMFTMDEEEAEAEF